MTMIPHSPPAQSLQQQTQKLYQQIPDSGKKFGGFYRGDPQKNSSLLQNTIEDGQQNLSDEKQRKLAIAKGHGLRVEQRAISSSGDTVYFQNANGEFMPCRRCGVRPCSGIRWIFDGEVRFKCNICGKHMKFGYTADAARENQSSIQGWDRADSNRRRLWREQEAERQENMMRDFDQLQRSDNPYLSVTRDRGFVMSQFFQ